MHSDSKKRRSFLALLFAAGDVSVLRKKIMKVFVLQHEYEIAEDRDETKFIGVYSTREKAESAISRLVTQPGFADHPENFSIDKYETDMDHWTEGFVTMPGDEELK
jgi:hypothetical protein